MLSLHIRFFPLVLYTQFLNHGLILNVWFTCLQNMDIVTSDLPFRYDSDVSPIALVEVYLT